MIVPLFFAIAVAGDWTGTSLCADLKALPACHDETVIYHITKISDVKVHNVAEKIVGGKPQYMGEFDMDVAGNRLTHEVPFGQRRALWDFTADGDHMTGVLKLLPGGEVVRKIDVRRKR
jgi:hypothetical protein